MANSLYWSELVPCLITTAATIFYEGKMTCKFLILTDRDTSATEVYYSLIFNEFCLVSMSKFHGEVSHRDGLKKFLAQKGDNSQHDIWILNGTQNKHRHQRRSHGDLTWVRCLLKGEGLGLWLTKQIKKLRGNETKELEKLPLKFGWQPLSILQILM